MKRDTAHDSIHPILPWYANGTSAPEERRSVEEHLKDCMECRDELTLLREIQATAAEVETSLPPIPDSLSRTLAAIDAFERSQPAKTEPGKGTLAAIFDAFWNPSPLLARSLVAAQLAAVLMLGIYAYRLRQDAAFTTLSGDGAARSGARLTVIFAPGITEEAMRRTLVESEVSLVSGPSANGIYVLELPVAESNTKEVDSAIAKLRSNTVILFVERQP